MSAVSSTTAPAGVGAPRRATDARRLGGSPSIGAVVRLFFRFPVPWILLVQSAVALAARAFLGPPTWLDLALIAGIVVYWPLQEWTAHAFVLHKKPTRLGRYTWDPGFAKAHRYHHRHPWVLESTFLPTRMILGMVPLHIAAWWLFTPTLAAAATGIAAFSGATLVYEWTHYLVHTTYRPKSRFGRLVQRNHRLHHFHSEKYWFAFTAPHLDAAFRTAPDPDTVAPSATVRTLGVADPLAKRD